MASKIKKKYLIINYALALLCAGSVFAENKIIYRAPNTSDFDFSAMKQARTDMIALDDYQLKNLVPNEIKENLRAAFIKAQVSHLNSQTAQNIELWQDVISYAFKADWQKNNREMIQMAYLRLAELSSTSIESKKWITQCFEYDPQFKPDAHLFATPTTEQYGAIRAKYIFKNFAFVRRTGFSKILINGTLFDLLEKKPIHITNGLKRITLLSQTYKPVTRIIAAEFLNQLTPEKELASQESNYMHESEPAFDYALHSTTDFAPSIEKNIAKDNAPQFYKKPWFWASTATLIGAIVIYNNSKQSDPGHTPTHREGL